VSLAVNFGVQSEAYVSPAVNFGVQSVLSVSSVQIYIISSEKATGETRRNEARSGEA